MEASGERERQKKSVWNIRENSRENMKQIKRIGVCAIVILAAFFYAHIVKTNAVYDGQNDSNTFEITENSQLTVEQEFICQEARIDGIQIKCQVQQTGNTSVGLTLTDVASGDTVAVCRKELSEIKSGKWNTFSFETVENCKGKTYRLELEGEDVTWFACRGAQPKTDLYINGSEQDGILLVKTVSNRFDVETFGVFLILVLYVYLFFRFLNRLFSR